MKTIILFFIGISVLITFDFCNGGTLSSYPQTKTLQNADRFPVVIGSGSTNANINWYDLKNIVSSGLNWTDIKALAKSTNGASSGINWQDFGA